jgi:type I restriction enzyme S subunit
MVKAGKQLTLSREPIDLNPLNRYSATGVKSFGRGLIHYAPDAPSNLSKMRYFRLLPEHLVISNIKAWEGAVAVTGPQVGDDAVISNRFLCYRSNTGDVDINFVRWYLLSERGLAELGKLSPGSADRNRTLSIDGFESLWIPSTDISEQRRIASWLSSLNDRSRSILGAQRRMGALSNILVERAIELANSAATIPLGRMVEVSRSTIEIESVSMYCTIGVRSFGKGLIRYSPLPGSELSKMRYSKLPVPSLIVSNIKAWEGAVALSLPGDEECIISNRFIPLVPRSGCAVDLDFLRSYLLSARGIEQLGKVSPGSADRNRTTSVDGLLKIAVPLLDYEQQVEIGDLRRRIEALGAARDNSAVKLDAMVPAALNQVFGTLN